MAPTARPTVAQPLSPHLQIYRWTWTMAMSIFHRVTGGALYIGVFVLAVWLLAMASGPIAYGRVQWFFGSIIGRLIRFAYTWLLMQHTLGGIKHLFQDVGIGFEPGPRRAWAMGSLVGSIALTVLVWAAIWYATRL